MTFSSSISFVVAAGSITGADHLRLGRDGQDGFAFHAGATATIAVVTDGCSSAPFSEVGARLGAGWLARAAERHVARSGVGEGTPRAVHGALLHGLRALARGAGPGQADFVADYLLFTYLVAVVDPASFAVFGVGDGAFAIDDRVHVLDSGDENMPPYAAYALLPPLPAPGPRVHAHGQASALRSLVLATDGAGHLLGAPELAPGRIGRNPSLLRKALLRARDEGGVLDDATCVAIVRPPRAPAGAALDAPLVGPS